MELPVKILLFTSVSSTNNSCLATIYCIFSSPQGLVLLCHLFVERNYSLWKDPEVLAWLERNVKILIESLEEKENLVRDWAKK